MIQLLHAEKKLREITSNFAINMTDKWFKSSLLASTKETVYEWESDRIVGETVGSVKRTMFDCFKERRIIKLSGVLT